MAAGKSKTVFFCKECGYESPKWVGQCPGCKEWNTMVEEVVSKTKTASSISIGLSKAKVSTLSDIVITKEDKISTDIEELDRVLGGGIVPGALILVGGDPGIGKSTLLLQISRLLSNKGQEVLYISGEESQKQIKLRAERIGEFGDKCKIYCETDLDAIRQTITNEKPNIVIIDSIQTMYVSDISSAPGSVSQVREATAILMRLAKELGIAIWIVGHVTKEGTVAGPRVLEHMVDTVLYFEGDRHASYRVLRGVKNRFGSTNEIGVFEMREQGLTQVENPSEYMLNGRIDNASGTIVSCALEGSRPLLIEIQALLTRTNFGLPRRQAQGTDYNRINLLMAVLEKRVGLNMSDQDAYVNITGGIRITEPAIDLAIVLAITSSFRNKPLDTGLVAIGEVGLSGEIRSISQIDKRVLEAKRLGFTTCVVPASNKSSLEGVDGINIIYAQSVDEAIKNVFK
jgi:DNA repair protein RadA/Sms